MPIYTSDDLMRCHPQANCKGCVWRETAEVVCRGVCIGEHDICPWLMVCKCVNPQMTQPRGKHLERMVLEQPPEVPLAPVAISRHRIRLGEYDIRQSRSEEVIRQIAASVTDHGLFAAPGGVAAEDGCIDLLMGHNRTLAVLSLLDWPQVPIRVFHWWGNDQSTGRWARKIAAFQENAVRQQMTFDEEVRLVYTYWQETGQTVREIADRFRMSRSWVQERITWGRSISGPANDQLCSGRENKEAASCAEPLAVEFIAAAEPTTDDALHRRKSNTQDEMPDRATFPISEIEDWLNALAAYGIAIAGGTGPKEQWCNTMNELSLLYHGRRKRAGQ